jgi:hypothetical protein
MFRRMCAGARFKDAILPVISSFLSGMFNFCDPVGTDVAAVSAFIYSYRSASMGSTRDARRAGR